MPLANSIVVAVNGSRELVECGFRQRSAIIALNLFEFYMYIDIIYIQRYMTEKLLIRICETRCMVALRFTRETYILRDFRVLMCLSAI